VLKFGEIVSVFGHEHELGRSFRMTLNAGRSDERILVDIPNWSFDWQYNYRPVDSIVLEPGDVITIECSWDRSRRDPNLEPAYILWANGTNDEMCFSTIATRLVAGTPSPAGAGERGATGFVPDPVTLKCLIDAGVSVDMAPARSDVAPALEILFGCAGPDEVGALLADSIGQAFRGMVSDEGLECLAEGLADRGAATELLISMVPNSTPAERTPIAELAGDCVLLSDTIAAFGLPLPDDARPCVDEAGRDLIVKAMVDRSMPEEQVLFSTVRPCLSGG
jgi:hypothetical protein